MNACSRSSALARVLALALLCLPMTAVVAAEKAATAAPPGKIAELWLVWPKPGETQAFEAAIKSYVAWRKQAGEHFTWSAYEPVVGSDLSFYAFRSGGHDWKDLDDNSAWGMQAKAGQEFDRQVGPHVLRDEHFLQEADTDHSHWVDSDAYRYFGVTSLRLKSGARGEMEEALSKVHKAAMDSKWPRSYEISWQIGGRGPMMFVQPFKSYADMAEPDPPFMKVLARALGSEDAAKAAMKQLNGSFEDEQYTVYAYRPDLSTPK